MAETNTVIQEQAKHSDSKQPRCRRCLQMFELNQLFEKYGGLYCVTCLEAMGRLEGDPYHYGHENTEDTKEIKI